MKTKLFYKTLISLSLSICTSLIHAQIPNYIPSNGLMGWWPFNGNANDESGNGNHGNAYGAALVADRNGNSDHAFEFNGDDWIEVLNNSSLQPSNSITISAWVYVDSTQPFGPFTRIISKNHNQPQNFSSYQLITGQYNSQGKTGVTLRTNSTVSYIYSGLSSSNICGQWQFIVGSYDGTNLNFYQNGILISSTPFSGNLLYDNGNLWFGRGKTGVSAPGSDMFFVGKIDDVGIWNRALTICEIQDLFHTKLNSVPVSAGNDKSICQGGLITLSGVGAIAYSWNNGVSNGVSFNPTSTDYYVVTGTDSFGCIGMDTVQILVLNNSSSSETQTALDNYLWPVNNQTYTQSGTYTQIIPNSVGCDSTITLNLILSYTGVNELNPLNNITIQPNPTSDFIYINGQENFKDLNFIICDLNGQQVLKDSKLTSPINIQKLPKGIYFLEIKSENNTVNKRIVKQ